MPRFNQIKVFNTCFSAFKLYWLHKKYSLQEVYYETNIAQDMGRTVTNVSIFNKFLAVLISTFKAETIILKQIGPNSFKMFQTTFI